MTENAKFNFEGMTISFDELVERLVSFVKDKPQREYKIVVGTDSKADTKTRLITAVAILRVGNGGQYFWTRSEEIYTHTMRERIFKEAIYSITFTQELKSRLKDKLGEEYFWDGQISVHLDVGQNGPTKDLVDGVVGMVRGYGLDPVIKPYSFGAFVLADRHT
jgi:predicted RNase H-related nuclease YkuK (DUF458 family)